MKRCPTCNRTYSDESLSFCLADGALLSATKDPQATLHIPASQVPQATQAASPVPHISALELRNITKRFGDVLANDSVNVTVKPGTIHAIVGENGAGKSTVMRIAYGFYRADEGEIAVDGEVRQISTPHDAIALGIGMVHQHFMLVEPMTVAENIVLGAEPGAAVSLDLNKAAAEIHRLSTEFKLAADPHAIVEHLSVGQQQRVELLKSLYRHARCLV